MQHTETEILNKASSISNGIETDASDSMTQVKTEVTDAIDDAKDKWEDAKDTLKDTETELGKIQNSMNGVRAATQSVQLAWKQFVDESTLKIQDLSNKLNTANLEKTMRERLDQGNINKDEFVKQFGTDESSKNLAEKTWSDYINNSSAWSLKQKGYSNDIVIGKAVNDISDKYNSVKNSARGVFSKAAGGLNKILQRGETIIEKEKSRSENGSKAMDILRAKNTFYNKKEEVPAYSRDGYYKII